MCAFWKNMKNMDNMKNIHFLYELIRLTGKKLISWNFYFVKKGYNDKIHT